jgi:very-short-patch-repair endonuclease
MVYSKKEKEEFAKQLRENPSLPEALLCLELDKYKIPYEFQKVIFGFIPDYWFPKYKKIVEVDGKHHLKQRKYDNWRDNIFKKNGIDTLRIPASVVLRDPFLAVNAISKFLTGRARRRKG